MAVLRRAEVHHRGELDTLEVEAVINRRVRAGDLAEVLLGGGSAKGDGGIEVRMEVELALVLLLQMRMVRAAGEMGGVAVAVIEDLLFSGGKERGEEEQSSGADY